MNCLYFLNVSKKQFIELNYFFYYIKKKEIYCIRVKIYILQIIILFFNIYGFCYIIHIYVNYN